MQHPGYSVNSTTITELTNCQNLRGENTSTPDGTNYVTFTNNTNVSDVYISGTYNSTNVGTDTVKCTTDGDLVDEGNGGKKAVDVVTVLTDGTNQISNYVAECSYYQNKGIKCIVTDIPADN